jgi:hypothetical protein
VLVAAAVAVLASVSPAVAAAPGWTSPQDLSGEFLVGVQEGTAFNFPDVAVSGAGDAVAVWETMEGPSWDARDFSVWVSERPLGGAWSAPRLLGGGREPRVATNAGTTAIAWRVDDQVVATVRRGGGGFPVPRPLGAGASVQAGADDAGAVTVVWTGGGQGFGIRAARNLPSAGWTPTRTISSSPTAQDLDLAVSGGGDAVAAWKAADGVRMTELTAPDTWSAHHLVAPEGLRPSVAANDRGEFVLAWTQPGGPAEPALTEAVYGLYGSIRGGAGAPAKLSEDIFWDIFLDEPIAEAAIGSGGEAVVAWNRVVGPFSASTVQVASIGPPGPWSYPLNIAVPVLVPRPSLVVLPDGAVIAAWRGGSAAVRSVSDRYLSPPRWDPPVVLSDPGTAVYNPRLVADDAGRVQAVWADLSRRHQSGEDRVVGMAVQTVTTDRPQETPTGAAPAVVGRPVLQSTPRSPRRALTAKLSLMGGRVPFRGVVRLRVKFSRPVSGRRVVIEAKRDGRFRPVLRRVVSGSSAVLKLAGLKPGRYLVRVRYRDAGTLRRSPSVIVQVLPRSG